jgi:hypothetical protein
VKPTFGNETWTFCFCSAEIQVANVPGESRSSSFESV